ncbi:MAG: hypothetical protein RIC14_09420 [Filomicrobium sp.]
MFRKLVTAHLAALLLAFAPLGLTAGPGLAKDTAATAKKAKSKTTKSKASDKEAKKKTATKKKKSESTKAKAKTKKDSSKSAAKTKPTKAKNSAAKTKAKSSAKPTSKCQGLAKTACQTKGCVWVKASKVNGKDRKAYCRKKPQKKK